PTVGRKQLATPWNAARGRSHPRLRIFSAVNGERIRGKDRSSCGWAFHPPCCCPSCFCQTSPGNPRLPASLRPSVRRSHREKYDQIASDGTVHHLRGPVVLSRPRIGQDLQLTRIFPLIVL